MSDFITFFAIGFPALMLSAFAIWHVYEQQERQS
jgi:hypothetical protein